MVFHRVDTDPDTIIADDGLPDHFSTLNFDTFTPKSSHGFAHLSDQDRENLLKGPTILLITLHSGDQYDYLHQCSAAKGVVHPDRTRQLLEQAESRNHSYVTEFPVQPLAAASKTFSQYYETNPGASWVTLNMGNVLPGYSMCILDWFAQALRRESWIDFVPADLSLDDEDKWYWLYSYSAMQSLGMDPFANDLKVLVERFIAYKDLVSIYEDYTHLLRALWPSDPIVTYLAERTAQQVVSQTLRLSQKECDLLTEHFPDFAKLVADRVKAYQSNSSS